MCKAHAFILRNGNEEKLLENVDIVELEGDEVRLVNIFGEQRTVKAVMKSYSNSEGKFVLEAISDIAK